MYLLVNGSLLAWLNLFVYISILGGESSSVTASNCQQWPSIFPLIHFSSNPVW